MWIEIDKIIDMVQDKMSRPARALWIEISSSLKMEFAL